MQAFRVTIGDGSEVFLPLMIDFAEGDVRSHWTLHGLEKLIALKLGERRLDRRGRVLEKPPMVEQIRRVPGARSIA